MNWWSISLWSRAEWCHQEGTCNEQKHGEITERSAKAVSPPPPVLCGVLVTTNSRNHQRRLRQLLFDAYLLLRDTGAAGTKDSSLLSPPLRRQPVSCWRWLERELKSSGGTFLFKQAFNCWADKHLHQSWGVKVSSEGSSEASERCSQTCMCSCLQQRRC